MTRRTVAAFVERAASPRTSEAVAAGVEVLSRYRLRSGLSMLGVALGVAAVVAMVSVGEGAREEALRQVSQLGLQNVVVRYVGTAAGAGPGRPGLTAGDADRVRTIGASITGVSRLTQRAAFVEGPASRQPVIVLAVDAVFFDMLGLSTAAGRPFSDLDVGRAHRVSVIGAELARELFGHGDPAGGTIAVDGVPYRVVGELAERRQAAGRIGTVSPRTFDRSVLVPWTALVTRGAVDAPGARVDEVWVRAREGVNPAALGVAVDRSLAGSRPDGADYEVVVPRELMAQQLRLRRTFDVVVGAIAGLTLLVGGIGVMNVMLTAVLERTPEIGLRRTVGATRRAIAGQFLAEALVISGLGGSAGLALGIAGAVTIGAFGQWPTVISLTAALSAIVVSVGVGLTSGAYPALRAAALNPIDAVRHE